MSILRLSDCKATGILVPGIETHPFIQLSTIPLKIVPAANISEAACDFITNSIKCRGENGLLCSHSEFESNPHLTDL